ncbi:MAG: GAF domain-containing protein [Anaerolineae bacterium]|nr:GAF domain-containing protein [Anaerolineae bacterium]
MSEDTQTLRFVQQENVRLRSENNSLKDYVARLLHAINALTDLQARLDTISSETNVYNLINSILALAVDAVDAENGSLMLLDEETKELVFVEVLGTRREALLHHRMAGDTGIAGWVVINRKARLAEEAKQDPLFSSSVDQITGIHSKSLICVPLIDGDRSIGAIEVVNTPSGRPFAEADRDILQLVGRLASVAIVLAERITT